MARVNSCTTFALQKKYDTCKQDSFKYCYTLLYQLVKPFIQLQSLNGLTTMVGQKIELVIVKGQWEVEGEAIGPPMSEDKGRCHLRISNLAGVAHKLKKNQMCRVKAFCRICKEHTCKDHLIATCKICLVNNYKAVNFNHWVIHFYIPSSSFRENELSTIRVEESFIFENEGGS